MHIGHVFFEVTRGTVFLAAVQAFVGYSALPNTLDVYFIIMAASRALMHESLCAYEALIVTIIHSSQAQV